MVHPLCKYQVYLDLFLFLHLYASGVQKADVFLNKEKVNAVAHTHTSSPPPPASMPHLCDRKDEGGWTGVNPHVSPNTVSEENLLPDGAKCGIIMPD